MNAGPAQSVFRRTLVTSALPYANGHIHLGHIAGAYLPADIYVRFKRLKGDAVLYIGGSDEHGVPITLTALKEGTTPQEVVDRYHAANAEAFRGLGISYDIYGRTSWPLHVETTQQFFRALNDRGHIHTETMELWYSEQLGKFLPDRYVKGTCPKCGYEDANGDECENCGAQYTAHELLRPRSVIPGDASAPVLRPSRHWFLDLPQFAAPLRALLDAHPEWRGNVRGIAGGWIQELRARCITRDTDWGVPIPVDDADAAGKRIYVWFDAPIGYITNTRQWARDCGRDESDWEAWWKDTGTRLIHFIGKDNVPFHAVIFPAMLMGVGDGYILPDNVVGNEYLNIMNRRTGKSEKGSKSRGNMISVRWALDHIGADAVRYYLCAIAPESKDSDFDWDDLLHRFNGELCDVVGNFVHRSLTMTVKNCEGRVPAATLDSDDEAMLAAIQEQHAAVTEALEHFRFRQAIERVLELGRRANVYFDAKQPWVTRKRDPARTAATLHVCCQVVKALCILLTPFVPHGAAKLAGILNLALPHGGPDGGPDGWIEALRPLPAGHPIQPPEVLFPKLDPDRIAELAAQHAHGGAM